MSLETPRGLDRSAHAQFATEVIAQIRTLPGIGGAAVGAGARPFGGGYVKAPFTVDGDKSSTRHSDVIIRGATPEYLPLLGVALRRGRLPAALDTATAPPVAVLTESAARLLFGASNPIGRRIRFDDYAPEIVGVIADMRSLGRESKPEPEMYMPIAQQRLKTVSGGLSLVVRVHGEPDTAIAGVRRKLIEMIPGRPIPAPVSIEDSARRFAAPRRFNMLLLTIFGIVALGIAATGIYGLMAYTVRRRTHEIGVRLALGARASDVAALVLKQGAVVIGLGIAGGLGGAWLLARTIQSFLFEIQARDAATFAAAAIVIALVALVACWLPMRRAARVDPVVALRAE
jgi:putative ABC transport system permease protein